MGKAGKKKSKKSKKTKAKVKPTLVVESTEVLSDDEYDEEEVDDEELLVEDVAKVIEEKKKPKKKKGKKKKKGAATPPPPVLYDMPAMAEKSLDAFQSQLDIEKSVSFVQRALSRAISDHQSKSVLSLTESSSCIMDSSIVISDFPDSCTDIVAPIDEKPPEPEPKTKKKKKKKRKKKKKKGPKLSKKERAKLAAENAEKARIEAELAAAQAAEEERIRHEQERIATIEKDKHETLEQQIRMEQLDVSTKLIDDMVQANLNVAEAEREAHEWELYVDCGKLPIPSKCDQMNTYLHLWEKDIAEITMEQASDRMIDVLKLLDSLEYLIERSIVDEDEKMVENYSWIRHIFRENLDQTLDIATYRLLRNIEKNLHRINIPTADCLYKNEFFILYLWLRIQLPTSLPNPRRPPKPQICIDFSEMKMSVQFPLTISCERKAIRAAYLRYDHYSDLCNSQEKPEIPHQHRITLLEATKREWRDKLLYKYVNSDSEEQEQLEEDDEVPLVPYKRLEPTPSVFVLAKEDEIYESIRIGLLQAVPKTVINLRKFIILGGLYMLNLLYQPPQPMDFVTLDANISILQIPKQLTYAPFYVKYVKPRPYPPGEQRAPEEIEEELKKEEALLEKLILVTIYWPEDVIFLELPIVCQWHVEKAVWTTKDIHDLKHNEEKGYLTFRTGKFGTFALATLRYANLPYQAWEIKPESDGTVTLQITATILMVELNVKGRLICIMQLQNSPNKALQHLIGTYLKLSELMRMMQSAGIDIFPRFDAFCYVQGVCEKHWPMEKHLYYNMAQLSVCFNFCSSRWNVQLGRRAVALQMREYDADNVRQINYSMVHVTPLKALFMECTEVSQSFSEEGVETMKFYPDLYHLMKGTTKMLVKNKIEKAPQDMIYALSELLIATRVLSFS